MKSKFNKIFALLMVYVFSGGLAIAAPALVIGIDGCGLLDGNGFGTNIGASGITVSANSSNGNVMHTCSADVDPDDSTKRSKIWSAENTIGFFCDDPNDEIDGCLCGIDGTDISTDDWHEVVSASGKAKLICRFKD